MTRNREREVILFLCFLTDMLLYWASLRIGTLTVLDTAPYLDIALLQRDRLVCVLLFAATAVIMGCYDSERVTDRFDGLFYLLLALAATLVLQLAVATLIPRGVQVISRRELVLSVPVAGALLIVWRWMAAGLMQRFASLHQRFWVLGGEEAKRIAHIIAADHPRGAEARHSTYAALREHCASQTAVAGSGSYAMVPENVVIDLNEADRSNLSELLEFCEAHFQRVFLYPSVHDMLLCDHGDLRAVAGVPLVEVTTGGRPSPYTYLKRTLDIAAAVAGLILTLPLSILAAVLIKTTSRGPVLYVQERLGKNGRPFRMYKFRSMRADVQKKDHAGHVLAAKNDPRVTRVGRFLRKHRIDEIPQLLNVLRGDMSLVGPRPVWREYYEVNRSQLPLIDRRLAVRPGLTSLSHVMGSYTSEPRDRLRYDLIYISTRSLLTDLKILFETVRVVLSGKGAQ